MYVVGVNRFSQTIVHQHGKLDSNLFTTFGNYLAYRQTDTETVTIA